jgi:hypothetical protein
MIKSGDLKNRIAEGVESQDAPPVIAAAVERRLDELLARIARARHTNDGEDKHCADCFRRGRDAALKVIDDQ